uniref:HhH-GPD domain-containing protein n=1 Tax=Ignisphaera aggregans TaxID=334771 RepID=A0A7J2U5F5_9CREN
MLIRVIRGIDYGLSLYYSYTLPLYDVKPVDNGFVFIKTVGLCKGLECRFQRSSLETICVVPQCCEGYAEKLLGLDSRWGFEELCKVIGWGKCILSNITLLYSPGDADLILYAILLSRNTDYFTNTLRWFKQFVDRGVVEDRSYIPQQVLMLAPKVKKLFTDAKNAKDIIISLLTLKGIGVKSVTALLLHAYGETEYAPVDRHYKRYLEAIYGELREPIKKICIATKLNCLVCKYKDKCFYGVARSLGKLNGYLQSLTYLSERLSFARSRFEEVLVPKDYRDVKALRKVTALAIETLTREAGLWHARI